MTLCVNDSGTWRSITSLCVNDSGTWRNTITGCINESGTWRKFGGPGAQPTSLGCSYEGGYAICLSPTQSNNISGVGVVWIVAPNTSEVSRTWYIRNDAVTTAQSVSGCTGWFIPTILQLQNPGYACRTYWDSYNCTVYWSSSEVGGSRAWRMSMCNGSAISGFPTNSKGNTYCVRAFRCVTY